MGPLDGDVGVEALEEMRRRGASGLNFVSECLTVREAPRRIRYEFYEQIHTYGLFLAVWHSTSVSEWNNDRS